jgi:hypothetical protein
MRLLSPIEARPYFILGDLRQAGDIYHPNQMRILLHRWDKAGNILALKNALYMTGHFYERHSRDPAFTSANSAILAPHSFLSLELGLQRKAFLQI